MQIDDATQAARINQKYDFSKIIGENHSQNVHFIAEHMGGKRWCSENTTGHFRLKTVTYQYFTSENELDTYCREHNIRLSRERERRKEEPAASIDGRSFGLTDKELQFCNVYLACGNATQAYKTVFPSVKNSNCAAVNASYLKKKENVKAYLAACSGTVDAKKC